MKKLQVVILASAGISLFLISAMTRANLFTNEGVFTLKNVIIAIIMLAIALIVNVVAYEKDTNDKKKDGEE